MGFNSSGMIIIIQNYNYFVTSKLLAELHNMHWPFLRNFLFPLWNVLRLLYENENKPHASSHPLASTAAAAAAGVKELNSIWAKSRSIQGQWSSENNLWISPFHDIVFVIRKRTRIGQAQHQFRYIIE